MANNNTIFGDNNTIDTGSTFNHVVGVNNYVGPDVSGVTVFGNSISATTGDTIYTNNIILYGTINGVPVSSITSGFTGTTNYWSGDTNGNIIANNGSGNDAEGINSLAEGNQTLATGTGSHAEGYSSIAQGDGTHAEGESTQALASAAHAEGALSIASGAYSHAEGFQTLSNGFNSHTEGQQTTASGSTAHAEGYNTQAGGQFSHTEGNYTTAIGDNSHVGGNYTIGNRLGEWARSSNGGIGQYGIIDLMGQTTDATPTEIFIGDVPNVRFTLENNSAYSIKISGIIRDTTSGDAATVASLNDLVVKNVSGTITIAYSPLLVHHGDASLTTASIAITPSADTPNQTIDFTVTGLLLTNIDWYLRLDYAKVI